MDPLRHPDLVEITHRLRSHYERVMNAEQDAAAIMYRRTQTLRDRMIDAEDRGDGVRITTTGGRVIEGPVTAVGLDHVTIGRTTVALFHVEIVEFDH
jgi:hypothetical protein